MKKWKQLYSINGQFTCPYCLKVFPIQEATADHKDPVGRFKNKTPDNIQPVCMKCNNEKGMLTDAEYRLWLLLDKVRNGNKDIKLLKNLEYVMYSVNKNHYRGF